MEIIKNSSEPVKVAIKPPADKGIFATPAYIVGVGWQRIGRKYSQRFEKIGNGIAVAIGNVPSVVPPSNIWGLWEDWVKHEQEQNELRRKQKEARSKHEQRGEELKKIVTEKLLSFKKSQTHLLSLEEIDFILRKVRGY